MVLPSRYLSGASQRQQLVEALSCEVHVSLGCLPGTLLERVKHVNSFGELGNVQHSMLQCRVHTDFPDAGSHNGHRFPVKRLQALLNPPELDPYKSPGVSRERSHIAPARGDPLKRFITHDALYKYQYVMSTRRRDAGTPCLTTACTWRRASPPRLARGAGVRPPLVTRHVDAARR